MNIFQFLMKRKGFCILFLKYLTIKVFLIKMCMVWFKNIQGLGGVQEPTLSCHSDCLACSVLLPVVSVTHPCGLLWALLFMGAPPGSRRQQSVPELWEAQAGVPWISTEATPALCRGEWSGRRGGWRHLSGMREVMVSRPLHAVHVDPPHTKVCEGQCA